VEEGVSGEGGRRTGASVEGGSSTQGELQHTTEVVWEVDVEDERVTNLEGAYVGFLVEDKEVQTLQNNFRMSGFHSLRVIAMGHMQVLLWSDKADEVEEVVETAGWWCSLFQCVVPWSPELVSNHRAIWLNCYGVPTHAWGTDLFRALAFKHGRFIEVDDDTLNFKMCDVARVKVLTKESKTIYTMMVVKVLGKKFEIRIVEECGGRRLVGGGVEKVGIGWQDDQTSRTSVGGDSNQAVAVGCGSESGSDADVSDTCQVLLEIQAHGGDKTVTFDATRNVGFSEEEMSGNSSNLLGNFVESKVNHDSDNRKEGCVLEGVGTEQVLVVEQGGAREDLLCQISGSMGGVREGADVERVCMEYNECLQGPTTHRIRKGDLQISSASKKQDGGR
jgi:hypothetical protein